MQIEYSYIKNLEQISADASSSINENFSTYNCILAYEFDVDIIKNPISDVTDQAQLWALKDCPNELHINHGSYIHDGLEHIISELKNKPSSNRALFSLISQKDISNTRDDPIPSFMIFQTCIDDNILYCTVYFRALEVSNFLRINTEEIRLKLHTIHKELLNFTKVRLVIFAFRGYNSPSWVNPLKKSKIDLMSSIEIYKILEKRPRDFADLIKEKTTESTVIYLNPLYSIKDALDQAEHSKSLPNFEYIRTLVNQSIDEGNDLKSIRTQHSHHPSVYQSKEKFNNTLNMLAKEFEKCPYP